MLERLRYALAAGPIEARLDRLEAHLDLPDQRQRVRSSNGHDGGVYDPDDDDGFDDDQGEDRRAPQ
jgi:hypothetical protein